MKRAVILFIILSLASGLTLLYVAFGLNWSSLIFFFILGLLCIGAAIAYTVGKKPYGYAGLGDLSVLIFFGCVGVLGSLYLFTKKVVPVDLLPALSCGFFSMAVLNINNIRDIESDRKAGKFSIPVRIGKDRASAYHWFLLGSGWTSALIYSYLNFHSLNQFLFIISAPLFIANGLAVSKKTSGELDPFLRQMALSTLLFVVLFGIGLLL